MCERLSQEIPSSEAKTLFGTNAQIEAQVEVYDKLVLVGVVLVLVGVVLVLVGVVLVLVGVV